MTASRFPLRSPAISDAAYRREQRPVFGERIRKRRPALTPLVDRVQHRFERHVRHALAEDVERLDQRHAGLEQRRQLLVENEKLLPADTAAASAAESNRRLQARAAGDRM